MKRTATYNHMYIISLVLFLFNSMRLNAMWDLERDPNEEARIQKAWDALHTNQRKKRLLEIAIEGDKVGSVKRIIASGLQFNIQRLLCSAALHDSCQVAEFLITKGADVTAAKPGDDSGQTPLHIAAMSGHVKMLQLLLRKGADVNRCTKGRYGSYTALAQAVCHNKPAAAALLVAAGADVFARNGRSLLHKAAGKGYSECVHALLCTPSDIALAQEEPDTVMGALFQRANQLCTATIVGKTAYVYAQREWRNAPGRAYSAALQAANLSTQLGVKNVTWPKRADFKVQTYPDIANLIKPGDPSYRQALIVEHVKRSMPGAVSSNN